MPSNKADPAQGPLILFHNTCFGGYPDFANFDCGAPCRFTTDANRAEEADAVVFHLPGLKAKELRKYPGQLWVAWSMESRGHTPLRSNERVMGHFDLQMNFERSADVWCPYLPKPKEWWDALSKPVIPKSERSPAVMFQSALHDLSGRNGFAAELMKHLPVDSYGRFLNNRAVPQPDRGGSTKMELISRYRFCLGLENTIEADYVTEKFFQPLLAGTVPVYRGAPNIEDFAPGDHCYIDATKFDTPRALARHLLDLAHDEQAYAAYFDWRSRPVRPGFLSLMEAASTEAFCRLGSVVAERLKGRG